MAEILTPPAPDAGTVEWAMSNYTKAEVGSILDDELRKYRAAYTKAKDEFDKITDQPSGIPHPARTLHVKNVSTAHVFALQAYTNALREKGMFITHGEIPDRFHG